MKKPIFMFALLLFFSVFLTGCWDYSEYEDIAQITGMGVDYDEISREITVTILYESAKKGKGGSPEETGAPGGIQWIVHSAADKTMVGAVGKIQEVVNKRLFFGYLKVLIIGEDLARHGLLDALELFDRTPAVRNADLVVAAGKAKDVLKSVDPYHIESASREIHKLADVSENTGSAYNFSINDFAQMLAIGGWEATAPRVIVVDIKPEKQGAKDGASDNIKLYEERTGARRVAGTAAFRGDALAGWLNEKESLGFGWITGKNIRVYKVSAPETVNGGETADVLFYRVIRSGSKIKVQMENGKPVVYVNVHVSADIRKYSSVQQGPEFILSEQISQAEQKLADSVRSDMEAALAKGQKELKSDIFGFGFALFRAYPALWRQEYEEKWSEMFPELPVRIRVDAKVINSGINLQRLIMK